MHITQEICGFPNNLLKSLLWSPKASRTIRLGYSEVGYAFRGRLTIQKFMAHFPTNSVKILSRVAWHNEELHNLYSSPSIIRIIKSRMMRWAEHVARMGEKRNTL
jgi:hypothetical protein